ncbi:LysR family transcriptional regulator [Bosea sp. RAF48]|uniref:LysR family transcriptional regulator n=1 Tax=Bosea sp. RAF48 TaxID=3237480 RepID=UPI003F929B7F
MDRLESIETFVRVAETGSFVEAARQLRVSRSVVTDRIKQLEEFVGGPLLHRSTRAVRLSELGQSFLPQCAALVRQAKDLLGEMRIDPAGTAGTLKVHALTGLVLGRFASLLRDFQSSHPELQMQLTVSDVVVDPIKAGVDCALQMFQPTSGEFISRTLFFVRRVFCAAPKYLAAHGTPLHPRDLHHHRLGLYSGYPTRDRWTFHRDGQAEIVDLAPTLLTNSVHLLCEYAQEQAGIVCLPTLLASEQIQRGRLELVLPQYSLSSFPLNAVYAVTSRQTFKLKLFIDHIRATFGGLPPWDEALIEAGLLPATPHDENGAALAADLMAISRDHRTMRSA